MRIVDNRARCHFEFEEFDTGDVFMESGFPYMKIVRCEYTLGDGVGHGANAMNLYNGEFRYFSPEEEVIPCNCELVLK